MCKAALLPIRQPDGSITHDTAHYRDIAADGRPIVDDCLGLQYSGGRILAGGDHLSRPSRLENLNFGYVDLDIGSNKQLMLILYAPGSDYAEHYEPFLGPNAFLFEAEGEEDPLPSGNSGSPESRSGSYSTSGTRSPNIKGPICGQYCAGPINLCTGNDGCKCYADPYQGTGSGYFTGTCKMPYFSGTSGRGLAEIDSNETLPTNESFVLPINKANMTNPACPCNCTYVSNACCTTEAGIVFEPPERKLGLLQPPNSTMVCNLTSGEFEERSLSGQFDSA